MRLTKYKQGINVVVEIRGDFNVSFVAIYIILIFN